jgi:hypothetical protein
VLSIPFGPKNWNNVGYVRFSGCVEGSGLDVVATLERSFYHRRGGAGWLRASVVFHNNLFFVATTAASPTARRPVGGSFLASIIIQRLQTS